MPTEAMGSFIKVLAVIGGGVLGGLVVGWLLRVVVLLFSGQKLPGWLHWLFRLLGGALIGWLTWLYVFGGGGSGIGGPGGSGTGGGKDNPPPVTDQVKDSQPPDKKDQGPSPETSDLYTIEVLGIPDLTRLNPSAAVDRYRCYRFVGGDGKLLTLDEVKTHLLKRQLKTPPLRRIILVLYKDSPPPLEERVADLKNWADQLPVLVDGRAIMKEGKDVHIAVKVDLNLDKTAPK